MAVKKIKKLSIPSGVDTLELSVEGFGATLDYNGSTGVLNLKDSAGTAVSTVNLPIDTYMDSASMVAQNASGTSGNFLKLVFNTSSGKQPVYVDMAALVDVYTLPAATSTTRGGITVTTDNGLTLTGDKIAFSLASTSAAGAMSAADKTKLDSIATYAHPVGTAPNKTVGLYKISTDNRSHVSAAIDVTKGDITALGIPAQDTTYTNATSSSAGLMSAADKTKLDTLPPASPLVVSLTMTDDTTATMTLQGNVA